MIYEGAILPDYAVLTYSENLKKIPIFLTENGRVIEIQVFRDLYKKDRVLFNKIINEISLRGGVFNLKLQSPLFPTNENIKSPNLIHVNKESNMKKLNFSLFNIFKTMDSFGITDERFFINVPLEGFYNIGLKGNDLRILRGNLVSSGFDLSKEPFKVNQNNEYLNEKNTTLSTIEQSVPIVKKQEMYHMKELRILFGALKTNSIILSVNIEGLLDPFFQKVFQNNELRILKDFYEESIIKKVNKLSKSNQKKIYVWISKVLKKNELLGYALAKHIEGNKEIHNEKISDILVGTRYSFVNDSLRQSYFEKLGDIKVSNTIKFVSSRGLGNQKLKDLIEGVEQLEKDHHIVADSVEKDFEDYKNAEYVAYVFFNQERIKKHIINNKIYTMSYKDIMKLSEELNLIKSERSKLEMSLKDQGEYGNQLNPVNENFNIKFFELMEMLKIDYFFEIDEELLSKKNDTINELIRECNNNCKPNSIMSLLKHFVNSVSNLLNINKIMLNNAHSDNEIKIVNERINSLGPLTLQAISDQINITRERVRQLESKILRRAEQDDLYISAVNLLKSWIDYFGKLELGPITRSVERNLIISNNILKNNKMIFDNQTNTIMDMAFINIDKKIISLIKEFEFRNLKLLTDKISKFTNEKLSERHSEELLKRVKKYLTGDKFTIKNNYIIPKNGNKNSYISFIVKNHFDSKGVNINNNDDFKKLEKLYNFYTENNDTDLFKVGDSQRKIEAILDHSETLMRVAPRTFAYIDFKSIPIDLMERIREFVEAMLIEEDVVYLNQILDKFRLMIPSNITIQTLNGILKTLYSDQFSFSRGRSFRMFKKGDQEPTTEQIIYNKVLSKGNKMSIQEIISYFHIQKFTVDNVASKSDRLIIKGAHLYIVDKQNVSESLKQYIKRKGNYMLQEKSFISSEKLYTELIFDIEFSQDLIDLAINNGDDLMPIIKSIFIDLEGHTKYLTQKNSNISTLDIITSELDLNKPVARKVFYEEGLEYGYAESTLSLILHESISSGKIIPMNTSHFIGKNSMKLTSSDLSSINNYLHSTLGSKKYISIRKLIGYTVHLPKLPENYTWSYELLNYFATQKLNYYQIRSIATTYLTRPFIITNTEGLSFEQIFLEELSEYNGKFQEKEFTQKLNELGLYDGITRIPNELFKIGIIYKNDYGYIYLMDQENLNERDN